MASEDSMNRIQDGTHCQTSESVTLCANGCGFFGSAATLNLCSVCYRDYKIKQERAAAAKVAVEMSLNAPKTEPVAVPAEPSSSVPISSSSWSAAVAIASPADSTLAAVAIASPADSTLAAVAIASPADSTLAAVAIASPADVTPAGPSRPAVAVKNRCFTCRKRVGVVGFSCRCGYTFCGLHRYPEEHACEFDFKTRGRDEIAKANPLVLKDKLERI